jgi:hypothetical protein
MLDKYNLVIKYDINLKEKDYNFFFENLIKNDKKVIMSNYIYHCIDNSNDTELNKSINTHINICVNNYIVQLRNTIRNKVKMNSNENLIITYINIINKFTDKIKLIKSYCNKFESDSIILNMCNKILCDPFIHNLEIFENSIMNINNYSQVKELIFKIKNINYDFYNSWMIEFIKKSINNNINIIHPHRINKNLVYIYQYNQSITYYFTYSRHYNYILTNGIPIISNIVGIIFNKIIFKIIETCSISYINCFFDENYNSLSSICKNIGFELTDKFKLCICSKIKSLSYDEYTTQLNDIYNMYKICNKYKLEIFNYISSIIVHITSSFVIDYNLFRNLIFYYNDNDNDFIGSILQNNSLIIISYGKELMLRLLKCKGIDYTDYEINKINSFKNKITKSQYYILSKIIKDYEFSSYFMKDYNRTFNYNSSSNITKSIIISNNIWDLKTLTNNVKFNKITPNFKSTLLSKMKNISNHYEQIQPSRELSWYLHIGKIEVDYTSDVKVCKLIMLPIQELILEHFDDDLPLDRLYSFDFIKEFSKENINKLMNIFVDVKLVYVKNNIYYLNLNFDTTNLDIRSRYFDINSISIENEIHHDKIDIVKTNISSVLKLSELNNSELFEKCINNISQFKITDELFNSAVEYMISREYIEKNNDTFKKIVY